MVEVRRTGQNQKSTSFPPKLNSENLLQVPTHNIYHTDANLCQCGQTNNKIVSKTSLSVTSSLNQLSSLSVWRQLDLGAISRFDLSRRTEILTKFLTEESILLLVRRYSEKKLRMIISRSGRKGQIRFPSGRR